MFLSGARIKARMMIVFSFCRAVACLGAFQAAMFDVGWKITTPSIFDEVVLLCCGCFSTWTAFCVLSGLSHFCCVVFFFIDGDDDVSREISISVPSCACVAIDGDFVFFFCFDLVMQGKNKRGKRARTCHVWPRERVSGKSVFYETLIIHQLRYFHRVITVATLKGFGVIIETLSS